MIKWEDLSANLGMGGNTVSSYVVSLEMPWFPPRGTERGGEILIGTYTNI